MKEVALEPRLVAERDSLRLSLHLNLAAAALKLDQWLIARTACEYVLMIEGAAAAPKARYRLAQALDGEKDYALACEVLERLLENDASNAEAAALLAAIRKRCFRWRRRLRPRRHRRRPLVQGESGPGKSCGTHLCAAEECSRHGTDQGLLEAWRRGVGFYDS